MKDLQKKHRKVVRNIKYSQNERAIWDHGLIPYYPLILAVFMFFYMIPHQVDWRLTSETGSTILLGTVWCPLLLINASTAISAISLVGW